VARIRRERLVSITQEHIDKGVPNDPRHCVFALAFRDVFTEAEDVSVGDYSARLTMPGGEVWCYRLPPVAKCIPIALDAGRRDLIEPMEFIVNRPMIEMSKPKPVNVKEHKRALPGEGESSSYPSGLRKANNARSAAARVRQGLKEHFGSGSRFLGSEI
jgi:hypothetical protein